MSDRIVIEASDGTEASRHKCIIQNGWLRPAFYEERQLMDEAKTCSPERLKEINDRLVEIINCNYFGWLQYQ